MLRVVAAVLGLGGVLAGCGPAEFAVRPIPRIASENVGQPVSRLRDVLGAPRKVDTSSTHLVYTWFLAQTPAGAPAGFHGCEMEVTVDLRSERVLGYSLANVGWGRCQELRRKIRVAQS